MIYGNVCTTASSSPNAIGVAWASLAAGTSRQICGIYGGASNIACHVDLIFGGKKSVVGTNKLRFYNGSGSAVSEWFGELGPVTKQSIAVKTHTVDYAAKQCYANLLYRIVL